jgi:hypothetical protein
MSFLKSAFSKKYIWLSLGLLSLLLRIVFGIFPTLCEYVYSRGFFTLIRLFVDNTWGNYLPFAMFYVFWLVIGIWALLLLRKEIIRRKSSIARKQWWKNFGLRSANFIGALLFFFMLLWGYNYARIPLENTMGIDTRKLNLMEMRAEADYISAQCSIRRAEIPGVDTFEIDAKFFPENLEEEMRNCLTTVLRELGYPTPGRVRIRELHSGLLYGFNSSGVYWPFTGEGHIESALHILQKPFTIAHEMGHGYGFGDEGTCNFLGYLACLRSSNPAIRYSGYLSYWRYVFSEVDAEYYLENRPLIDRGMFNDLEAIHREMKKYFEFLPGLQEIAYDAYLRMQGIEDGLQNYDRMILLVAAMRRKH